MWDLDTGTALGWRKGRAVKAEKKNRKRIRRGARLPDAERAEIDPRKLWDYALDPERGGGKAKGFRRIGISRENWPYLHAELLSAVTTADATHADITDPAFVRFTVPVRIEGPNGKQATVITGWCCSTTEPGRPPWLSTLYVKRRFSRGLD